MDVFLRQYSPAYPPIPDAVCTSCTGRTLQHPAARPSGSQERHGQAPELRLVAVLR